MQITKITPESSHFPDLLKEIPQPPQQLYCWGNLELLQMDCFGIVGTRLATSYGLAQAGHFSAKLAQRGLCIVSGLAYGIDAAAHRAAMEVGKTIAVLAQGLDVLQPVRHRALAKEIVARGGLVISEKAMGESAQKYEYLVRNRIISGLSQAVLVVEAGVRSGASNTASHAGEQGRDVMALPGRCTDPMSMGCHELIKKGAALVQTPNDILELLGMQTVLPVASLSNIERRILKSLSSGDKNPAELAESFEGPLMDLYENLHLMMDKGMICCSSGQRYSLSASFTSMLGASGSGVGS